jgi:hypothetical protein
LLYGEGFTIRGVQRILREQGPKFVQAVWEPGAAQPAIGPGEETQADKLLAPDEAARTLFGLLNAPSAPEREPEQPAPQQRVEAMPATPQLTRDQVRQLQTALHELRECRELIDRVLTDEAA